MKIIDPVLHRLNHDINIIKHDVDFVKPPGTEIIANLVTKAILWQRRRAAPLLWPCRSESARAG